MFFDNFNSVNSKVPTKVNPFPTSHNFQIFIYVPVREISNNVICATSKASDQPAHMRSLIRAYASRLSIL